MKGMREINLAALLVGLQKENPTKSISLIRLIWPDIKAALQRGHTLKEVHARLVKGGLRIGYKKLSVYVSRLRREDAKEQGTDRKHQSSPAPAPGGVYGNIHRVGNAIINVVPTRRLFSASAAAQYLGMNGQTLRKITDLGELLQPVFADKDKKVIETLGYRLRKEGRLHVDLLQRFGEDLLDVVRHLEEQGIPHRDIKPDNIAVGFVGRSEKVHLVLFDFSLSRTPPENIRAGIPG